MENTLTPAQIEHELAQCYGTESYTRHIFGMLLTDGIVTMREICNAYWLVDAVASYQHIMQKDEVLREFQVWHLDVDQDENSITKGYAILTCTADSGLPPVVRQVIEYTDFPLKSIDIWVEGEVMLLPSEH